jgi:hypothetical protein
LCKGVSSEEDLTTINLNPSLSPAGGDDRATSGDNGADGQLDSTDAGGDEATHEVATILLDLSDSPMERVSQSQANFSWGVTPFVSHPAPMRAAMDGEIHMIWGDHFLERRHKSSNYQQCTRAWRQRTWPREYGGK